MGSVGLSVLAHSAWSSPVSSIGERLPCLEGVFSPSSKAEVTEVPADTCGLLAGGRPSLGLAILVPVFEDAGHWQSHTQCSVRPAYPASPAMHWGWCPLASTSPCV